MGDGVLEHRPVPGEGGIDQQKPRDRRHQPVVEDIEPAGTGHPFEAGIEDQQGHHAEPEDRHGVADEAEDAHGVIDDLPPLDRRQHAHGNAQNHADQGGQGGELQRGREEVHQVVEHRPRGLDRGAEVAGQDVGQITQVLNVDRLVEPQLQVDGIVDILRRPVADNGQHRIDRHDPTDQEGDGRQADKSERQR